MPEEACGPLIQDDEHNEEGTTVPFARATGVLGLGPRESKKDPHDIKELYKQLYILMPIMLILGFLAGTFLIAKYFPERWNHGWESGESPVLSISSIHPSQSSPIIHQFVSPARIVFPNMCGGKRGGGGSTKNAAKEKEKKDIESNADFKGKSHTEIPHFALPIDSILFGCCHRQESITWSWW